MLFLWKMGSIEFSCTPCHTPRINWATLYLVITTVALPMNFRGIAPEPWDDDRQSEFGEIHAQQPIMIPVFALIFVGSCDEDGFFVRVS